MIPLVATLALAIVWALPLSWPVVLLAAPSFVALGVIALARRARTTARTTMTAAICCVSLVGAMSTGYAALALSGRGGAGDVGRTGYPFLIATGLRIPGGAGLLALCALVSLIPALFPDEAAAAPSSRNE